jgi:carbamoyl-phosphate synthase large subunit
MTEPELTVLNGRFGDYPACRWVFAGEQVLRQCLDKLATARMLESLGLPAPWTILAAVSGPREYPCILKSRSGSGSRSVHIVKDAEEAAYLSKRDSGAIFQELLLPADREVTCAVYRTRDGRVTTLQMLRRLVGGFTGWARVIDDQPTTAMCEAVAHHLDLRGSMNVQLRITGEGPRIFEINPRFSSTSLMRHRLGFSDVLWALTEAEGGEVSFPAIAAGSVLVRLQAAAVMDDNQKAAQP